MSYSGVQASVWDLFSNRYILCAVTAWILAQALKIPTYYLVEKKLDWNRFLGSGGMPSSHTASVFSLTLMVGALNGFDSVLFAISIAFTVVVMYDATGVRRETGKQGAVINEILRNVLIDGKPISDDDLKELVGHTPFEVAGGMLVGLGVALFYIYIF
ncbi:MAG: divergent PAP2 family protein [bacterium]|nr:divergent PAP2 family protein [bacterium]